MSAPRWNNKDSGNLSSPSLLADASSGETVLSRNIFQEKLGTTPIQNQIDGLVSGFVDQATDWKSLAAMTAGGLAYRWGKISVLGVGAIRESPLLARPLSIAFGLGSEVTAFEFTQRTLTFLSSPLTPHSSPNLWSWSGPGGWKEGLLNSLITFGTLKGFGTLSQGQNIILQHGFQDAGMVLGHQLVYHAGIGPRPEGSLAEQLVHAEVTNLQIGAGMGLGHALTGGRILAIERGMDLNFSFQENNTPRNNETLVFAMVSDGQGQKRLAPSHVFLSEKREETDPLRGKNTTAQKADPGSQKNPKIDPEPVKWHQTFESLKANLQYIFENQLNSAPDSISTSPDFLSKTYRLLGGQEISGWQLMHALARFEQPGMTTEKAIESLGGRFEVLRLLKTKYLGIEMPAPDWDQGFNSFRENIQYIFESQLQSNPNELTGSKRFYSREFRLKEGGTVTGLQIFLAYAHLAAPGKPKNQTMSALGGKSGVAQLIREKILGIKILDQGWDETEGSLIKNIRYIFETQLNSDPHLISTGERFLNRDFRLPEGKELSGHQIINAVALMEGAESTHGANRRKIIQIIKEKYLCLIVRELDWWKNNLSLKQNLQYIFETQIQSSPEVLSGVTKFLSCKFSLKKGGEVTGAEIISAIARRERPMLTSAQAIHELGGDHEVFKILKEKYLNLDIEDSKWDRNFESARQTLQAIFKRALDANFGISWKTQDFLNQNYTLPNGQPISGLQILNAIAGLEMKGMSKVKALKILGYSKGIGILREKYLGLSTSEEPWRENPENLKEALKFIFLNSFGGEPTTLNNGSFLRKKGFLLPNGGRIKGHQLFNAFLEFEKPGMNKTEALKALGGASKAFNILKEKYLGISSEPWKESPEKFKEALKDILDSSGEDLSPFFKFSWFLEKIFSFPNGQKLSGLKILYAAAYFENPGYSREETFKTFGGENKFFQFFREKYLGLAPHKFSHDLPSWSLSPEVLKKTIEFIFEIGLRQDSSKISTGNFTRAKFLTPEGITVTGKDMLDAIVQIEKPELSINAGYKALGGGKAVIRILKQKYLNLLSWDQNLQELKKTLELILNNYCEGDPNRLSTVLLSRTDLILPNNTPVSGGKILFAIAGFEKPGMTKGKAYKAIGIPELLRILKEKYLGLSVPKKLWAQDPEKLKEVLRFILENSLEGDPRRISSSPQFVKQRFLLPDGTSPSGQKLLSAVAGFERPDLPREAAIESVKRSTLVKILKEKYLGIIPWNENAEQLKQALEFVLKNYLRNDPTLISAGLSFTKAEFRLQDGTRVTGFNLLFAVAALEMPGIRRDKAMKALGDKTNVVQILKDKYLGTRAWNDNPERIKETLEFILQNYFEGDPSRITSHIFPKSKYRLPEGSQISGLEIISAVAGLERPGIKKEEAVASLGREAKIIEIIKTKYLNSPPWNQNPENLKNTLEFIFKTYLNGDPSRINTSSFAQAKFCLPDGTVLRGGKILYSVAGFEKPEMTREEAYHAIGGARVAQIIKEKYLGVIEFSTTPPRVLDLFIQKASLTPLLDLFAEDPALLIEALSFLKKDEFKNKDVTEFVKAYLGLQVEKGPGTGGVSPKEENDSWEKRRKYILAILQALESGESLDLSELNFHRQLNLLIRLSRKAFEENPEKLIEDLASLSHRATHPFIQRLQQEAARHFEETLEFEIQEMRTDPYGYQREGAHFLVTHDKAILADEAGMGKSYQVIAAVESLGLKRILWVTTASNKGTLEEEIPFHSHANKEDVKIVISGDPRGRKEQIRSLNGERYVITNYETLVTMQKDDPEGYRKLTSGIDLIVVDEAQFTDNPATLRTKAIHDIHSPRRWLLTATPYQNKPENMWSLLNWLDPKKYPDFNAFKQMYTQNTEGLILLHSELANLMLRRTKKDTLTYFLSADEVPFDQQLSDGIPRLPQKMRILPEKSGAYALSPEQADLIAWMTADFRGWAEHFNANLPNGAEPIEINQINSFLKFDQIHKVIYQPEHFGISTENPVFAALDQALARRLALGEKVILWAWNVATVEALAKRYEKLGVRKIYSDVTDAARESARHDFQENPNVRILVANYLSGGVGLTLTAAHSAIFVQLPSSYPKLYQAEGRHQRLIGRKNLRYAKDRVDVEWMVPKFPEGFVEGLEDQKLKGILSHGTLVEQTHRRLEGGEILYNLLLEGYGNTNDWDKYFKAGIIESLGLNREEKLDYISHLKGEVRTYAEVAQALLPLWKLVKGHASAEENTLRLLENFKDYPALAKKIGASFEKAAKAYPEDLEFISSLFQLRNKYIREQMLKRVPDLLVKIYGQGKSLKETAEGLKIGKLSPAAFLAQIYSSSGAGGETIIQIIRDLSSQRDTPAKRYLEEHFFSGVFGIMGNSNAEILLSEKEGLLSNAPLLERIHMVYRLGLLARTRSDLLAELQQPSFDTWKEFSKSVERATNQAIAEFAGRTVEQVEEMEQKNPNWINADPILALIAGWQEHNEGILVEQFREVVSHLLDGDYREWRYGPNHQQGNEIDYLSDHPEFWEEFQKSPVSKIPKVMISSQKVNASFMRDYLALIQEARQEGEAVEGRWVHEQLQNYRDSDEAKKEKILKDYQQDLRVLGKLFGTNEVTKETKEVLDKYRLNPNVGAIRESPLQEKAALQEKLTEIRNLVSWMNLDNGFRRIHQNQNPDQAALIRELDSKVKFYRGRKYDKMADHWETLKEGMERFKEGALSFKDITIEDTDDPAILTRMGALHPEMTNCFNPNGNPTFNQFVVGALGSKNMKMVVVREQGKIVAIAMMKVKQLEDGTPVLFLEKGLYRKGYDFQQEMLNHLFQKAQSMSPRPMVMVDVPGRRPKETDWVVMGTGAYTENEYVESVFGLRSAKNVKHRGRIDDPTVVGVGLVSTPNFVHAEKGQPQGIAPTKTSETSVMTPIGIGTSNKPITTYLQELKDQHVTLVVDVRGAPFSRIYPHFNKEKLSGALKAQGIEYVWLGDKLGNPKDAKGERTLEGFQNYMKTDRYQEGLARLLELLQKNEGQIALTCAEGAEAACHRKFILADLTQRLLTKP